MKRIMAVYDVDPFYANKFAEFANRKEKTPFMAVAFTSLERLYAYAAQQPVELLLVGDDVDAEDLDGLQISQIIRLGESGAKGQNGTPVIYKYQSSDQVLREVMACYQVDPECGHSVAMGRKSTVIGIHSPINRCGKTVFALTMGQILAKDSRVLYLNLEEHSGLEQLLGAEGAAGLSELLYYFRQGQYSSLRLRTVVHTYHDLDFVPPVTYGEDLAEISGQELAELLAQIAGEGGYEILLLDLGQLGRVAEPLLELCNIIYVPVKEDCISTGKLTSWKTYLENSRRSYLWERMRLIRLPPQEPLTSSEKYLEQVLWGSLGDYVRGLLKGQDVEWRH